MIRALLLLLTLSLPLHAQEAPLEPVPGNQSLADILARQDALRSGDADARAVREGGTLREPGDPTDGIALAPDGTLGPLNDWSDPGVWRDVRLGDAPMTSQQRGPAATTLIQTGGMEWLQTRAGPLRTWGGGLLLVTLLALAALFILRGRIRIEGPRTGRVLLRFRTFERFAHWLLAGSFIALAVTGLLVLFGRVAFIPLFGNEAWAPVAIASKWVHDNVSWAFMIGLVMVFVLWAYQNIPNRSDLTWLRRGGGIFGGGHVPAKKFNAGQKLIFWAVIIGGASLSVSGLSMLFPFELPLFAKSFGALNATGIPGLFGNELNTALSPQEEMQYAQLWHGIIAFVLTAVIFGHIYLGTIGMEGAYDAMGKGVVEEQWAREHHSIWAEKALAERDGRPATSTVSPDVSPAE